MQELYTWTGHYFGYKDGDDLWTYEGRHVGKFNGFDAFDPSGHYLGEIRNGFYLIRDTRKIAINRGSFSPRENKPPTIKHVEHMGFAIPNGYEDFPKL
jgi:hypothetical protein